MKLWVDHVRPAPEGYMLCKTASEAVMAICEEEMYYRIAHLKEPPIGLIDLDNDYEIPDYMGILNWLEDTGRNYPIRIHGTDIIGVENMRRIIERNGWTEVK